MLTYVMFTFCPSCRSEKIVFERGKVSRCPDCGFTYYHNTAAAVSCLVSVPADDGERIMFLIRGKDPAKGKLDLPGGFVDNGEGALEGLRRELQEELGWTPPLPPGASPAGVFNFFASFPNMYPYKNIVYNTCDLFFSLSAPGLREQELRLEEAEIAGVRFIKPEEIDFDDLAFDSVRRALRAFLGKTSL